MSDESHYVNKEIKHSTAVAKVDATLLEKWNLISTTVHLRGWIYANPVAAKWYCLHWC